MFCPRCAYQLPDGDRFCAGCGVPVTPPGSTPKLLFCVECGTSYHTAWKFCNACGKRLQTVPAESAPMSLPAFFVHSAPIPGPHQGESTALIEPPRSADSPPETTGPEVAAAPFTSELTSAQADSEEPKPPALNPPYARLALIAVALALTLSVSVFCIADDVARKHLYFEPLILLSLIAALMLVRPIRASHGALKRMGEGNGEIEMSRKRLRSYSILFGAVFSLTAALVGFLIGISGAESEKLLADYERFNTIGAQISKLRNSTELTLPAQLAMYDKLCAPVEEFQELSLRVKSELGPYDQRYPAAHTATEKWIQGMDHAVRRAELLQKQIETAKLIAHVESRLQYDAWHTQMQPILDEEKALDDLGN